MGDNAHLSDSERSLLERSVDASLRGALCDNGLPSIEAFRDLIRQYELRSLALERRNDELGKMLDRLEHYRDRYVDLYDFAPLGYITLDEDGYVQEVNLAGAKMLAVDREELIGYSLIGFVHEQDGEQVLRHIQRCVRQGEDVTSEATLVAQDGRSVVVQMHSIPVQEDEETTFCKTAMTDITARRLAEQQTVWHNAVLHGITELFHETLTCTSDEQVARKCLALAESLTGSQFGFMCEVNPGGRFDTIAISDTGWEACRIPQKEASQGLYNVQLCGVRARVVHNGQSLISNDPTSHPDWVRPPPGHPPIRSYLGVPLNRGGKTIGLIALANKAGGYTLADQQAVEALSSAFIEAVMHKRTEQALQRSREELDGRVRQRTEELARSHAELQRVAHLASHDLQEPLRRVADCVTLLAQRYKSRLDAEADASLRRALDAAKRIQELLEGLKRLDV